MKIPKSWFGPTSEVKQLSELEDEITSVLNRAETGLGFIEQMMDNDNRVFDNHYSEPIVEIIVPSVMEEEVKELIEKYDVNPQGPETIAQPPSFKEEHPEVAEGLTSFQFNLDNRTNLESSGYDLPSILDELANERALGTRARIVEASLW